MLKVLFVIDGLWVGGTERSLAEMLPHLLKLNVSPTVVCLRRCGDHGVEREVLRGGFDVRFIEGQGWVSRVRELRGLIRKERPHIVHTSLYKSNIFGRMAAAGLPVSVLSSLVNTNYSKERMQATDISKNKVAIVRHIDSWTGRHLTTHFHAVSNAAAKAAEEGLKIRRDRITVIERGRDPARFGRPGVEKRSRARAMLGLSPGDNVLVNVGRHEYEKAQIHLLQAMAKLDGISPAPILLIAGRPGKMTAEIEGLRKHLGLERRVHLLGHRDDIPDILAAADLFVFPSIFEGLPGAVIEAMAMGLPIVASDIPSIREIVEEGRNALLSRPASSDDMALAISRLLSDRSYAEIFGRRGREIFEERFTMERSTHRMVALYERLVDLKRPSHSFGC